MNKYTLRKDEQKVNTSEVIGKKILARGGKKVGVASAVYVHPTKGLLEGVEVNTGTFSPSMFIASEYIRRIGSEGVLLNIDPVSKIKGKTVFDSKGKEVGKVKEVKREKSSNRLVSVTVDRGLIEDDLIVAKNAIRTVGENIVMSLPVEA